MLIIYIHHVPKEIKMLPYLLIALGGVIAAVGMSYFPAMQARKGFPIAIVGLVIGLASILLSEGAVVMLLYMLVFLCIAPSVSFLIHDIRTRKNKKR